MTYDQKDIWVMQLATFLVTRYSYQIISVQQTNDELWLANPDHKNYLSIRITKQDIDDNYFDKQRVKQIHSAITRTFKKEGKCLEFYMNEKEEVENDDNGMQVTIHPNWQGNEHLQSIYPGIDKACHDVANPDEEYAVLSTSIFAFQQQEKVRRKKVAMLRKGFIPYVSTTVGVICVIIFLLSLLLTQGSDETVPVSILLGGNYKAFVIGMNEWFRFFTSGFVHVDAYHLFMNMMVLFNLGNSAERVFGHKKYAVILLGSIVMGSCFVFIGDANKVTIGLSGGLYGVMSAMLVYFVATGIWKDKRVRDQFIYMLVLNAVISFMPGISFFAHLGGFVGGIILGIILVENERWKAFQKNTIIASIVLCIGLIGIIVTNRKLDQIYFGTDLMVAEIAERVGMDFYGKHIFDKMLEYYEKGD